jgi:hypothetical protein
MNVGGVHLDLVGMKECVDGNAASETWRPNSSTPFPRDDVRAEHHD